MAYYLRWSPSTGDRWTNNEGLQISGLSGVVSSIQYTVKQDMPARTVARYIFDFRRRFNSTNNPPAGVDQFMFQNDFNTVFATGLSGFKINGASVAASDFFLASADDICYVDVGFEVDENTLMFGSRYSESESSYGFAVSEIIIVDAGGAHTIDMSDSGGTGTSLTSTDGALTATLYNFPTDNSQWVSYGTSTIPTLGTPTATAVTSNSISFSIPVAY